MIIQLVYLTLLVQVILKMVVIDYSDRWTDSPDHACNILMIMLLTCKGSACRSNKWYGVILKMHILLVKLWL